LFTVNFEPVSALRLQPGVSASSVPQNNAIEAIFLSRRNTLSTVFLAELALKRAFPSADLHKLHGLSLERLFHITDIGLQLTTCFFDGTSNRLA